MQNLGYVVIQYYGNTAATATTITSSNLVSGSYTLPDLSLNTLYTFTLTPYSTAGSTGNVKTLYIDTSPSIAGVYVGNSTSSSVQLQWYGSYSYVAISQSVNGGAYVDLSAVVVSTPYTVSDVSGNTALSYKVTPYYSGTAAGTASSSIAVTTNVQAPLDLSAIFIDVSSIQVSFTVPKNTYSSVHYTLRATDASGVVYKDVSGTSSPLWITNLSGGKVYSVVAKTTLDNSASFISMSNMYSFTTLSEPAYSSFVPSSYTTKGTSTDGYMVYTFTSTTGSYTINYTAKSSNTMYVLTVGGGGGGGSDNGGGGGGGGVAIASLPVPVGSDTITITIGSGGSGSTSTSENNPNSTSGSTTTFAFTTNTSLNMFCGGGGKGTSARFDGTGGNSVYGSSGAGGSGTGSGTTTNGGVGYSLTTSYYKVYSNTGGNGGFVSNGYTGAGGGGAGGQGGSAINTTSGVGGDGIQYTLPGIKNYLSYGSYYWGGGGGGGGNYVAYNAGKGGAGSGSSCSGGITIGGTTGFNSGGNGGGGNIKAGAGGANTGGGGGGGAGNFGAGGNGGSGIVIIAIKI
jgi:hypothetical protein